MQSQIVQKESSLWSELATMSHTKSRMHLSIDKRMGGRAHLRKIFAKKCGFSSARILLQMPPRRRKSVKENGSYEMLRVYHERAHLAGHRTKRRWPRLKDRKKTVQSNRVRSTLSEATGPRSLGKPERYGRPNPQDQPPMKAVSEVGFPRQRQENSGI